jgi:PAS domain S-box-containing protein
VIGVLSLRATKPNAYTEGDLRLAERVGNQIAGAIANAQLFAEHKRTEEALRESERRFKDLYDYAPLGYHEYDTEGRITNVNRTDLEMLGYTAEEMIGQPIWKLNVNEETVREQVMAKLAGTLPPGKELERIYRRKDGTIFPVLIEDRLILDEKGRIKGIRCTIQDITGIKKTEEALRMS